MAVTGLSPSQFSTRRLGWFTATPLAGEWYVRGTRRDHPALKEHGYERTASAVNGIVAIVQNYGKHRV
jgi:hypothetical protein